MRVLFMMPRWEDANGGWMRRMMDCIADDVVAIAVEDSHGDGLWGESVPVVSLSPPRREVRGLSRLCRAAGMALEKISPKGDAALRRAIARFSVTHVLCQYGTYAAKFMDLWRSTDVPLFIHFHGYDVTFDLRLPGQPDRRQFADTYLPSLRELQSRAVFIANSQFTRALLLDSCFAADRIAVKGFGVLVPEQRHLHTKRDGVQVLHLGRLVDFKSPDRTIRAFEIARARGMNGTLVMAGDGPLRVSCELLRLRSPYKAAIRILGSVGPQEAEALLSVSDIFTQHNVTGEVTRQSECFGVSIVEAMASGLPVVGTRSGAVPETVVDGETGILVEPGDDEAQADAFLRLAKDPDLRQQMGDAGRARVATVFSPQQEADGLRRIMRLPRTV